MSFLTEAASRRMANVSRTVARTSFAPTTSRASFTTSVRLHKSATESAKDTLKNVDRAVSNKVADGIDVGGTLIAKPFVFNVGKHVRDVC